MQLKKCAISWTQFSVSDEMESFLDVISPNFYWKKYLIPTPKLSPEERMRRRLAFRNERTLYHRFCDITGKKIISIYCIERWYKVLSQMSWWWDQWNAKDYGQDFDFSRNFNDQFSDLLLAVPHMGLVQQWNNVNADYCNCMSNNKDSYLIFNASDNEGCAYGSFLLNCKNTLDCFNVYFSENCYECIDCTQCYECFYCQDIKNSSNLYYCFDCQNSKNCFACVGLRNKQDWFYILNRKVDAADFEKLLSDKNQQAQCLEYLSGLYEKIPKKYSQILFSENSTGGYLEQVKNSSDCWDAVEIEDCHYCGNFMFAKKCYDVNYYWVSKTNEFAYDCEGVGHGIYDVKFCKLVWGDTKYMMYCYECFNCEQCFGCTGLKSQKYCIFNKQYTQGEYEKLVPEIIKHMEKTWEWGEFFDPKISPFGYNETVANDFLPLIQMEAYKVWFMWKEDNKQNSYIWAYYSPLPIFNYDEKVVSKDTAQKNIVECLSGVFECIVSQKNFKITMQEILFYVNYNLEIPKKHPDERYKKRFNQRLPRKLTQRKCQKCSVEIQTAYPIVRKEKIYCESCYNKEIY